MLILFVIAAVVIGAFVWLIYSSEMHDDEYYGYWDEMWDDDEMGPDN